MPRSIGTSIEQTFVRALMTEATGLNFPENACTETFNCVFERTGQVHRRLGVDFELGYATKTINRTGAAISTHVWKNVGGDGSVAFLVVQVGGTIYFWDLSQSGTVSDGPMTSTVLLSTFQVAASPDPNIYECQFADGNGALFVTNKHCEPFYVTYNAAGPTFTGTSITLKIRDFKGVNDTLALTERPVTLSDLHKYNLANQGWTPSWYATSTTSLLIGTGSKIFTTQSGKPITVGERVRAYSAADPADFMVGNVTAYTGTTLTVNVTTTGGSGTDADWEIRNEPDNIRDWFGDLGNYPSNADVWWLYKNSTDDFDPAAMDPRITRSNSPAPKGHYILNAFSDSRATVSGISGITETSASYYRPLTCAFFAGRAFYAGVTYQDFTSNIYFSQIIEDTTQYGYCYQTSDPTSENLFDLLPSDGGVIKISDCAQIVKLWSLQGVLLVFATNGIWAISGSQGIGFTANDYSVRKISTIAAKSASSFVSMGGYPCWWADESIYTVQPSESDALTVTSFTNSNIQSFYQSIPASSRLQAKGAFNLLDGLIYWTYRSTQATSVEENYSYDSILIFDVLTGGFYPWTISGDTVHINGVFVAEGVGTSRVANQVVRGADTVVDGSGNLVVQYDLTVGNTAPAFKYLCSYPESSSYKFTFALNTDTNYLDWYSYNSIGEDFESYFITGYKIHGEAQKKFQTNYLYLFSDAIPSQYTIQGQWNWSIATGSTKWSTPQTITPSNTNYSILPNRIVMPGFGLALQYKVASVTGEPFSLIGWSAAESANARP